MAILLATSNAKRGWKNRLKKIITPCERARKNGSYEIWHWPPPVNWSIIGSDMTSALGLVYNIPYFSDTLWTMSTSRIPSLTVSLGLTLPPMITGSLPPMWSGHSQAFTVMLRFQGSLWISWPLLHWTHHLRFLFVRSLFHPWTFIAWY